MSENDVALKNIVSSTKNDSCDQPNSPNSPFDMPSKSGDVKALPIMKSPLVKVAPFILVTELCERLAYYGIATNIVVYVTTILNYPTSQAATTVQAWSGVCYFSPLIGGFFADSYLGRYWTILIFSISLYAPGLILLALSSGIPGLYPPSGQPPTSGQLAVFWIAMFAIALGTGGIKPCVSSFGADQFDSSIPAQAALIPRYFNYFYAAINIGSVVASVFLVYIQEEISWTIGFIIPAVAFVLAVIIFLIGTPRYRKVPPGGSPWTRFFRVATGAIYHRKVKVPEDEGELYEAGDGNQSVIIGQYKLPRTASFKFLEKACTRLQGEGTPIYELEEEPLMDSNDDKKKKRKQKKKRLEEFDPVTGEKLRKSRLVTLTEVEEFKILLRLLPVAATLIMYNAVYSQMTTMFVLQGQGMNTYLGSIKVPAATVSVLDSLSIIVLVFIYDLLIDPFFKRIGRPITFLQRIGWGYIAAILSMVVAGIVETFRLQQVYAQDLTDVNPNDPNATVVSMSVWVQAPQYILVALSEVLSMIGSLNMFYEESSEGMRSTTASIQLLCVGLGSFLSSIILTVVQAITTANGGPGWVADNINQGHMQYYYYTLAVLMAINLIAFFFIARRYRYKSFKHHTVDIEALAMAPDGRAGLPFNNSMISSLSRDFNEGMETLESKRSAVASELSASYSQYMPPSLAKRKSSLVNSGAAV